MTSFFWIGLKIWNGAKFICGFYVENERRYSRMRIVANVNIEKSKFHEEISCYSLGKQETKKVAIEFFTDFSYQLTAVINFVFLQNLRKFSISVDSSSVWWIFFQSEYLTREIRKISIFSIVIPEDGIQRIYSVVRKGSVNFQYLYMFSEY